MTKINCDMGESFGIYNAGNDEEIMPLIDVANVACGFHASDPKLTSNAPLKSNLISFTAILQVITSDHLFHV